MKIQLLRKKKGFTQGELADLCGTTQQQIAKIEGGLVDPKLSTLRRIATSLNVDLQDLFYRRDEFVTILNDLIEEENLKGKRIALAMLNGMAADLKKIPHYHPYWEQVNIKNQKIFFMEEKNV